MRTPAVLPSVALLLFVLAGAVLGSSWGADIQARERARLAAEASQALANATGRVDAVLGLLDAAAGLFAADPAVTPETWRSFLGRSGLPWRYPGLLGVGWSQRTPPAGVNLPGSTPDDTYPIQALEPGDQRTPAAMGYDLFANPLLRVAMERARDSGAAAASAKVVLFTAPAGQVRTGFFLFVPFYRDGGVPGTVEERRAGLQGFVFTPCQPETLFAPLQSARTALAFELRDGPSAESSPLLYPDQVRPVAAPPFFSSHATLDVGGRTWTFAWSAPPPPDPAALYAPAWTAALASVLAGLLAAGGVWSLQKHRRALQSRAATLEQRRDAADAERLVLQASLSALDEGLIATDTAGHIQWMNPAASARTGWSMAEARDLPLGEVFRLADGQNPGNPLVPLAPQAGIQDDGSSVALPEGALLLPRDGPELPVAGSVAHLLDEATRITGFLLAFRDSPGRRQSEDERRRMGHFGPLADALPQKILVTDAAGQVEYGNRQACEFSGMTLAELAERGWQEWVHGDDRDASRLRWQASLENGEAYFMEHRLRRADGAFLWHQSRAQALRSPAGGTEGWVLAMTDIDDMRRTEQQRSELLDRERMLRNRAEDAARAREEFLAVLSHELRTPLNAIRGWTQTLLKGNATKQDLILALTRIEQSAHAQARLIDDLLNMAEIIAGRLRLEIRSMHLIPAIEAAVESLRPGLQAKSLHLECQLDPAADAMTGDAVRLQQVVWNLVSNAVKFTPEGGKIRLELNRTLERIELLVSDSGEGIDADFLPYVFNRFRQGEGGAREKPGSLGLGLTIARHLVELHGGTVRAESPGPGQGARFTVSLPVLTPREPESRPLASEPSTALSVPSLKGLRILSVDDDRNTREMLQEALVRAGAEVLSAANAAEAMNLLVNSHPDVLVADIGLPGEDGYSLLRRVRDLPPGEGGATPAVAITGYAREEDRDACLAAGFQAYATKPVGLDELFGLIAGVAGR